MQQMQDEFLRYLSSDKYLVSSAHELPFLQKQTRKNNKVAGGRKPMATMKLGSKQPEIFVLEGLTWLSHFPILSTALVYYMLIAEPELLLIFLYFVARLSE
jgi:hypothetical protein